MTVASNIRVACGYPATAYRSGTLSQIFPDTASRDKTIEILISPVLDKPSEVLVQLVANLCHATPGSLTINTPYQDAAKTMGLEPIQPNWKSIRGDGSFDARYAEVLSALGPYPHAAIVTTSARKKQTTRMLKAECDKPKCGYHFRVSNFWAAQGLPKCICGGQFKLA